MKMTKIEADAYVSQKLQTAAEAVYEELFGDWKNYYFYYLCMEVPKKSVFIYQAQQLLPYDYMNDVQDAKPNSLYNALLRGRMKDAQRIIKKAQFLNVKAWAEQNGIDYRLAKMEIRSIWLMITGEVKCYPIPVQIADDYVKWVNGEFPTHGAMEHYEAVRSMKNAALFNGVFETCRLVLASIVLNCTSETELYQEFERCHFCKEWMKQLSYIWGSCTFPLVTDPQRKADMIRAGITY